VNLDTGGFHCFNCQASGGDIVDFVMLRDRLDFKRAAMALGAWDDSTSGADMLKLMRERDQRREREDYLARLHHERMILVRDYLHACERAYMKANRRLHELGPDDAESAICWELLPWLLDEIRQADSKYRRLAGVDA
jgi:hypothetical protein